MVALVLQELGEVAVQANGVPLPVPVAIGDGAGGVPLDSHEELGEGHAVVPKLDHAWAQVGEHRVDQGRGGLDLVSDVGVGVADAFQEDDPLHHPDLWRGDGAAHAPARPEGKEGVA